MFRPAAEVDVEGVVRELVVLALVERMRFAAAWRRSSCCAREYGSYVGEGSVSICLQLDVQRAPCRVAAEKVSLARMPPSLVRLTYILYSF